MSEISLDDQEIGVPCPECGKEILETIGNLRRKPELHCGGCGADIHVDLDTEQLDEELGDLNRSLDKLLKF